MLNPVHTYTLNTKNSRFVNILAIAFLNKPELNFSIKYFYLVRIILFTFNHLFPHS